MSGRVRALAVALSSVAALAACNSSKSEPTSSVPPASVALTVSATTVIADGTSTVTVGFTNTGGGSATITTTLGTFQSTGTSSVTTSSASGTVTLVTCSGCAGTATVTMTASAGTASKSVAFVTRSAACQTSCSADSNCNGLSCALSGGGTGVCASGICTSGSACTANPAGATTETSCSDGIDNDCNGVKDCGESSCDGQPCKVGAPTFVCKAGACTDLTSGLALTVTPARTRLPATGTASTDVAVTVTYLTDPAANLTVSVSLSDGTLGTIAPASAVTGSDGTAHFTFSGAAATGTETVTARIAAIPTVSASATITLPRLASLRLVTGSGGSAQYEVMGAKGSGWQDLGWLKVQAVDDLGLPYPDGLPVRFEHHQLGLGANASTLGIPLTPDTATCLAAQQCVGYEAVTASTGGAPDSAGVAQAWLYSGTVAGTLPVTATASAAGASFTILLPTVAVVGAKASGSNFSVVCSPRNVPALAETDCSVSLVDAPFTCEAILKDRFQNVLGRATQVVFESEAGSVGQIVSTPAYDPTTTDQAGLGLAVQTFQTLGNGLPFDVAPLAGLAPYAEPAVVHGLDGCGLRTHNPRDGVVTVIAVADGEEAFFDANGNGSYDAGEPFVDLGEPFVDQNDDGVWEPGEWFLDLDGNGTWTGPNGRWDANTKIWTQTFVVYTGTSAALVDSGGALMGTRIVDPSAFVDACVSTAPPTPFDVLYATTVHPATSQPYVLVASDQNFNFLQAGAGYAVDQIPSDADLTLDYFGLPSHADEVGMSWQYWPCAQDGTCASQCRATGANAPCVMRPVFTAFSCGYATSFSVTGGSKPAASTVRWDVTVPYDRYGSSVTSLDRRAQVSGASR